MQLITLLPPPPPLLGPMLVAATGNLEALPEPQGQASSRSAARPLIPENATWPAPWTLSAAMPTSAASPGAAVADAAPADG
ncbi:hypothetical protein CDD83_2326 [Cordyceps sp. RAO-2017]|nr:hypothetical protein CDD83_2326 [Cordyceps sp. RAO-2017]